MGGRRGLHSIRPRSEQKINQLKKETFMTDENINRIYLTNIRKKTTTKGVRIEK